MFVLNITDEYDKITFTKCTDSGNNFEITKPILLLTKVYSLSVLCLIGLMIYTMLKTLFSKRVNNG